MCQNGSERCFRIKLEFDVAPPAFPVSSKYMILVKPDECKTVYDLEMLIIRKFGYSNGTIASLSVDGFYLPSAESVHLLSRDDLVKVSTIQEADCVKHKRSKRARESPLCAKPKKSKVIRSKEDSDKQISDNSKTDHISSDCKPIQNSTEPSHKKQRKSRKRKLQSFNEDIVINGITIKSDDTESKKKRKSEKSTKRLIKKKEIDDCPILIKNQSSESSSSDDKSHSKLAPSVKPYTQSTHEASTDNCQNVESSQPQNLPKPKKLLVATKGQLPEVPVVETCQSDVKASQCKQKRKSLPKNEVTNGHKSHITFESSGSSMEEESNEQLDLSAEKNSLNAWLSTANASVNQPKQTWHARNSKHPEVSTNISSIYTNPEIPQPAASESTAIDKVEEKVPKNYIGMLPSTWPPRAGDLIAYKILEMSSDYTPVVSEYKEAKIKQVLMGTVSPTGVDSIQVELLTPKTVITRIGGRYEMDFDDETVDESCETSAILEWKTLLEPKLIQ